MSIFSPIGYTLLSRTGFGQTLADVCVERFEVGTAALFERRPAVCLQGSLDRVTGVAPMRTLDLERRRLEPGEMLLPACVAYVFDDILCVDGNLYKGFAKYRVSGSTRTLLASISKSVSDGVLVSNGQSHTYFGHWMTEELPGTSFAADLGPVVTIRHGRNPYTHEFGYLQLCGLPAPAVLPSRCRVGRLTVLGENSTNTSHLNKLADFRELRAHAGWQRTNRRVFIRRGGGSPRSLANESDIIDYLSREGFDIVDPERLSAEEVAARCYGASVAVGVEGSHMAHAFVQMFAGASFLLIQPPDRFNNPFKDLCDAVGINYGFAVADALKRGFALPIDRLAKTLEILPT